MLFRSLFSFWTSIYGRAIPEIELEFYEDRTTLEQLDIRGMDVDNYLIELPKNWAFYPEQLYTSEDFATGDDIIPMEQYRTLDEFWTIPYGTYRTTILGDPNQYYTICGYTIDYGTKVFVDGIEIVENGVVADNAQEAEPCVNFITFPIFTGDDGQVELIFQYSNFAHYEGGSLSAMRLSTAENIERYKIYNRLPTALLCGGFLILFAYYLVNACMQWKREYLLLAICCLMFALRDQRFHILQLVPFNYDWPLHYRILVLIAALSPAVLVLLARSEERRVGKEG